MPAVVARRRRDPPSTQSPASPPALRTALHLEWMPSYVLYILKLKDLMCVLGQRTGNISTLTSSFILTLGLHRKSPIRPGKAISECLIMHIRYI